MYIQQLDLNITCHAYKDVQVYTCVYWYVLVFQDLCKGINCANSLADQDIRLGGGMDTDIRLRANLIRFPVLHVYFFVGGWPKSIAKLDGGMAGIHPWIRLVSS